MGRAGFTPAIWRRGNEFSPEKLHAGDGNPPWPYFAQGAPKGWPLQGLPEPGQGGELLGLQYVILDPLLGGVWGGF